MVLKYSPILGGRKERRKEGRKERKKERKKEEHGVRKMKTVSLTPDIPLKGED